MRRGDKMLRGLYIHMPFCAKKCRYCSFVSYANRLSCTNAYADAVVREMAQYQPCDIATVYFGGGTPSVAEPAVIGQILAAARERFAIAADAEITLEANPATVTASGFAAYREMGINRISFGAQSMVDAELRFLGRLHTAADTVEAVKLARQAGLDNISLDLMFGLPGQDAAAVQYSTAQLAELSPEHLSCYALTIEEGTPLHAAVERGEITPLDDDLAAEQYEQICWYLQQAGYVQYEISNFARKGRESRHNSHYWRCGEYIGLGAGAAGYVDGVRYHNTADLDEYLAGSPREIDEVLNRRAMQAEFMILGLRLVQEGVSVSKFEQQFGEDVFSVFGKQLENYDRFIRRQGDVLKLEPEAYYVCNAIFADFLPEMV